MINHDLLKKLYAEVDAGRVTFMGDKQGYILFKYSIDTHFGKEWNQYNREARGIIFHAPTSRIVCRPFAKFFNCDELPESQIENLPLSEEVITWEKVDGSCCSAYLHDNAIRISTPGSYESPQAIYGSALLNEHLLKRNLLDIFKEELIESTPIFELIWPESLGNPAPGVINYGHRNELILLAIRNHSGSEWHPNRVDIFAATFGFKRPRRYNSIVSRELTKQIGDNEEGFVVQFWPSCKRVKFKSEAYMLLHKVRDIINLKGICEILEAGESRRWLTSLPKHLAARADDILAQLNQEYFKIYYKVKDIYDQAKILPTRKEQAIHICTNLPPGHTGLAFAMLDNKFIDRQIWGVLRKAM